MLQTTIEASGLHEGQTKRKIVVDVGCGTGLCGALFRATSTRLIGSDISAGMMEEAEKRGVFDELYVEDMITTVQRFSSSGMGADLILAADVMVYVKDLADIFDAVRKALAPGGPAILISSLKTVSSMSHSI